VRVTKIVLGTILAILLALAGALAYLPVYLESHKGLIEASATRVLRRSVEIQGGLALSFFPSPSLAVQGLQIRNPDWTQRPLFARAERLEVQLDLRALAERRIRVARILVHGADIDLERGPQGQTNWTFSSSVRSPGALPIEAIEVLDSSLDFETPEGPGQHVGIGRLNLQVLGGTRLALAASLSYRDVPFSVSATTGKKGEAQASGWPFSIHAKAADATLEVEGHSAAPFEVSGIEANFSLRGVNLQFLEGLFSSHGPASGPFRLAGRLTRASAGYRFSELSGSLDALASLGPVTLTSGEVRIPDDAALTGTLEGTWRQIPTAVRFDLAGTESQTRARSRRLEIEARLGDTSMRGRVRFPTGGSRPKITGDLSFNKIDLTGITRGAGARREPAPPEGAYVPWSERPLPLAVLGGFDADLTVKADLVAGERLKIRDARGHALLDKGQLRLEDLMVSLPGLPITGRVTLDTAATPPLVEVSLSTPRAQLPRAISFLPVPRKMAGDMQSVTLRAKAEGNTPMALLKTIGGTLMAGSARFRVGGKQAEIRLEKPTLVTVPGKKVVLHTGIRIQQQALTLDLIGGHLADLLTQGEPWPVIEIVALGKLDREAVELRGEVGSLTALLAGRDLRTDLTARWQGIEADLQGTLARLDGRGNSHLALRASGESLSSLGRLLGANLRSDQPFDVSARLEGGDRRFRVRDLKARSGESDIVGDLRIRQGAETRVAASLRSHTIDLTPYLDGGRDRSATFQSSLAEPLPLDSLRVLDGALSLKAGHVRIGDFGIDDTVLDAILDAGNLHISADAGDGRLILDLGLRPEGTKWRWSIKQKGKLDLSWLIEEENLGAVSKTPATLDVRLAGVGDSLQGLLGSADGRLELVLSAGRLNKKVVGLPLGGVLVTLLDAISIPSRQGLFEGLKCAVFQFDVAKGIATSTKGLAVQTAAINAIGSGALNLRSGEIELHFKTTRRKGIGISLFGLADQFVYITGTLSKPKVAIDPKSVVLRGGAAWATGGLSLLYTQLAKRLTAFGNPCDLVLDRGSGRGGWWLDLQERL
jgi:uncharacterized protein involved in outer membrane biogenesis